MLFGLSAFPLGQMGRALDAPPRDVVTRLARAADELGYAFVSAQHHVVAPREWASEGGTTWFEPFSVLSVAAAVTTRVRLLTDVIVLPYASPFATAKAAATLDVLSEGRLTLGVAAGYLEREFEILGAEFAERGAWTDEAIEVVKACWTNEWVDVRGRFFDARDVAVSPRPRQQPRPPIWVGGNSARALRRAIEHGDGWTPFRSNPETIAAMVARGPLPPGFDVCVPLRAHGDRDAALRTIADLSRAGVTACRVSFPEETLDGYLRAMEAFATDVVARAG